MEPRCDDKKKTKLYIQIEQRIVTFEKKKCVHAYAHDIATKYFSFENKNKFQRNKKKKNNDIASPFVPYFIRLPIISLGFWSNWKQVMWNNLICFASFTFFFSFIVFKHVLNDLLFNK